MGNLFYPAAIAELDRHMEMRDSSLPAFICSLDAHEIVSGPGETMLRHGIAILRMLFEVAV